MANWIKSHKIQPQIKKISLNISENLPRIIIAGWNNSLGFIIVFFLPKDALLPFALVKNLVAVVGSAWVPVALTKARLSRKIKQMF
ncbi:hypothetical protein [Microcoleus sp. Pol10D4]|uniref:hypothetical protein n=1 Tax=Microcoleus sp. Pol10D4 TaxID=3055387 RepID=UPI002FD5F407